MSKTTTRFLSEVRECAVRPVPDNQGQQGPGWQAVLSISSTVGCVPRTLNDWVKKAEADSGRRAGIPTGLTEKTKVLDRENRVLRRANEILPKASRFLVMAEFDRRSK
jgi:transposase-like protein